MKRLTFKRLLSLILVVMMTITALPLQVLADSDYEEISENEILDGIDSKPFEQTVLLKEIKAGIAAVLNKYLGTTTMSEDDVWAAVQNMDEETQDEALLELYDWVMASEELTDAEMYLLGLYEGSETAYYLFNILYDVLGYDEIALYASASGTHKPVTGVEVSVTGATDNSISGGSITVKAKGSSGFFGYGASSKTTTITVKNTSGAIAEISFNWTASSVNELKIDGTVRVGGSGSFGKTLAPNETVTITITTGKNNTENKLVLSGFLVKEVQENSQVTVNFDDSLGSVTVDGSAISSGHNMSVVGGTSISLKATAAKNAAFVAWIDENGKILSQNATDSFAPAQDTTVRAIFASKTEKAWFLLNSCLYDDLTTAINAAKASSGIIALAADGTLPAGNYTIPSGVTLLIPFDAGHTLLTTNPITGADSGGQKAFRTLTMANGAGITLESGAAISVGGKQCSYTPRPGTVAGPYGCISMADGSTITVKSGANLYVWGYIIGSGTVTVKNGGTVYEDFQVTGFRGGNVTSQMAHNTYGVFPFNQYYVQNIEVPMILEAGAIENAYMSVHVTLVGVQGSAVPFIGPNGMFNINSGSITKDYDEQNDRLIIEVNGKIQMKSLSITMKLGLLGSTTLNSSEYALPVTNNITVHVKDGGDVSITQDIAMLPGSELIVDNGGRCVLGSGNKIYLYASADWCGHNFAYSQSTTQPLPDVVVLPYIPGKTESTILHDATKDARVEIAGEIDASKGFVYVTASGNVAEMVAAHEGAKIRLISAGSETQTYQANQDADGNVSYPTIAIKPLALKDGVNAGGLYTYTDGNWEHDCAWELAQEQAAGCTTDGYKKYQCKCGNSKTEAIPAHGHTAVTDAAVAPTCTATGLTEGSHCSVCGEVLVKQEVVAAKGHTLGAEASCTAAQTCTVCGAELEAALGHSYTSVVTAPTCTEDGYTTYTCSRCGDTYTDNAVAAKGHTAVVDAAVDATCTATGLTEGSHCSVCNEVIVAQEVVAALGHTVVTDAAVDATCTATGLTEGSHCSVCNEVLVAQTVVAAKGHTVVTKAAVDPTCTATGLTEGSYCSDCGETLAKQTVVPAKGHTLGADASCTDAQTCTVCGTELEAALGHSYTSVVTAPTCTEGGYTTHTCGRCGNTYTDGQVDAKGHTESNVMEENRVDATCTADGSYDNAVYCTVCSVEISRNTVTVPAFGHTVVTDAAVEATCTATGLTEGSHCSVCNEVLVAQEVVAALGHTVVTDAAVDATCTKAGLTEGSHCSVCNAVLVKQTAIAAKGHTEEKLNGKDATCTETGLTSGLKCSVCGEITVPQKEIAAKGHTEEKLFGKKATCTEDGLTDGAKCFVCQTIITAQKIIPATGHNVVVDKASAPTCTAFGYTEGSHCSNCKEIFVEQIVIPMLSHVAGPEVTCTEDQICILCNTYVFVEALGHNMVICPAKAPTRTEYGHGEYEGCSNCGISSNYEIIAPLGKAAIETYDDFIYNLALLEELANLYVQEYPAKDPVALVIKYIRTGVERYNSGSWGIMAGYEDSDFAKFVTRMENEVNAEITDGNYMEVTGLKNLSSFKLPNGQSADIGHVFGAMDITYHNKGSVNHADVSGWAGDLVDLLEASAANKVSGTLDEMIKTVGEKYFLKNSTGYQLPTFSKEDYDGDLDAFYIVNVLQSVEYGVGEGENEYSLAEIIMNYMTEDLTDEYRAAYFMTNRLLTNGTREQVRNAVYAEYLSNKLIATLEGTRNLSGAKDLNTLRRAVCYAFADYICKLAGDYVENLTNPYYSVFSTSSSTLAPGVTQDIKFATSADGKQMAYYVVTADITREDVNLYANYHNNDPAAGWEMSRVLDQANAAQNKYGNPDSEYYIPNYNVVAATNGAGYDMSTGEPGGLLVMGGVEYHEVNSNGFFGILKDGTPVIATTEEYKTIYKDQVQEAIACFGTTLVRDGEICVTQTTNYYSSRASRTAAGITATGKIVLMVLDGRQEPFSCGGSMIEIAQIMLDAGCVHAVNLDGGGSSTYVAKQPGDDEISLISRPSDGFQRSVSTSWMIVSTAPSSTEFDHAMIESEYKYATIGAPVQMKATGISPAGNETDMPEGYTWAVSDEDWATISADGVFTGKQNGTVNVYAMLGDEIVGMTEMNIVVPESVYFTRTHMDAIYGANTVLPVAASYQNKPVAFRVSDFKFSLDNTKAGTIENGVFVGNEASGVKVVKVTACLANDATVSGSITLNLFKQGENSFDFSMATGGDRNFAWLREISDSTTVDNITYTATSADATMTTDYTFAIDMSQIPIPAQLADLTYMLPGADVAENATAWNFLLQLAERVSVLTEIKAEIDFDDNLVVDISEMKILNEYFELKSQTFDETTNTLVLTLNWIDQTQAIDPTTANPLCMVSGIKLTPKADANWDAQKRLSIIHTGTLSYEAYLRANALYSFAQKPENQELYGLTPFVNPDPQYNGESGASFGDTYLEFEDSYTLAAYTVKDGWTVEEGGFAYYKEGKKLTGVNKIDGYYYDFGENGINKDQTTYTGMLFDEEESVYRYSEFGVLSGGWKQIEGEWYLFDEKTLAAVDGIYYNEKAVAFNFDNGRVTSGVWTINSVGVRYWYGPDYYRDTSPDSSSCKPFEIDGKTYLFSRKGYLQTGIAYSYEGVGDGNVALVVYYDCGEDGAATKLTGAYGNYFYVDGIKQKAYKLVQDSHGDFYFIDAGNKLLKNTRVYLSEKYVSGFEFENGDPLPAGRYEFDADGKMIIKNGPIGDYFYTNNVIQKAYKLVEYEGNFYFIDEGNKLLKNTRAYLSEKYVSGFEFENGDPLPAGHYEFDADGKMIIKNGIIGDYFYKNNVVQKRYQLVEYEGNFYFIDEGNKLLKNTRVYLSEKYVSGFQFENGDPLPAGRYEFDADGKMVIKNGPIGDYFYKNNVIQKAYRLVEYEGNFYFIDEGNKLLKNTRVYLSEKYVSGFKYPDGLELAAGHYEFDAEGKMIIKNGIVGDYLYKNGVIQKRYQLVNYGDDFYFIDEGNKLLKNIRVYLKAKFVAGVVTKDGYMLEIGDYTFDENGRMVLN